MSSSVDVYVINLYIFLRVLKPKEKLEYVNDRQKSRVFLWDAISRDLGE